MSNPPPLLDRLTTFFQAKTDPTSSSLYDTVATLITSTYDLETLVYSSRDMISRELKSNYVKIILIDRTELLFYDCTGHHKQKMFPNDIPRLEALSPAKLSERDLLPEGELKKWLTNFEINLLYKLEMHGNRVGYLFIGDKSTAQAYSKAELETLGVIVEQLAVAFANALGVRRISAFNEELKAEVEKATQKLARANEELKELDQLKDEFVSMASHELKSPLNAVKNYLWLALNKGKDTPEKMDEYLHVAFNATEQVLFLVNDLLDVSRIETGRIELKPEPLNLFEIVTETSKIFENLIKEKDLALKIEIEPSILVKADSPRLREILSNLISNAIKYTIKGNITIKATVDNGLVTCSVIDTGIGINPEDQTKLFDKFIRLKSSYKELASVEGTGLGLYITRKLVELMGGTIGINSQVDQGSTFWFTLPKV